MNNNNNRKEGKQKDNMSKKIPCVDHLGNKYESRAEMLRVYNISDVAFLHRLNKLHWSLEKTLTEPKNQYKSTAIKCTDHLGNEFQSKEEMAAYWNIPRPTFFRRIRDGWSLEDALTKPIKNKALSKRKIIDPENNIFETIEEMCSAWDITKEVYMWNMRHNMSIYDALTHTTKDENLLYTDDNGNIYSSLNELARAYNINKTVIRSRLELGWTLSEILKKPSKIKHGSNVKDHLGNKYKTRKEMLDHYGVSEMTFKHRKKLGHDLETCLSNKNLHIKEYVDHLENKFDTFNDLREYYFQNHATLFNRLHKQQLPIKDAVMKIAKNQYNKFKYKIIKQIDPNYCIVIVNNMEAIIETEKLLNDRRQKENIRLINGHVMKGETENT